jgi:hypothetical protein
MALKRFKTGIIKNSIYKAVSEQIKYGTGKFPGAIFYLSSSASITKGKHNIHSNINIVGSS